MSEFFFGVGHKKLPAKTVKAARRIGADRGAEFVHVRMPEGWRYWFAAPNMGHPFDDQRARDVYADLEAEGVEL